MINYRTRVQLDDDTRAKWSVNLEQRKNLELMVSQELGYHRCTQEDFDRFNEPAVQNADFLVDLKMRNSLFCLDNHSDLDIYGRDEIDSVSLTINYNACTKNGTTCQSDQTKEELLEFLETPELVIYYNSQQFKADGFKEEDMILKSSRILNLHVDKSRANWMKTKVVSSEIVDTNGMANMGKAEHKRFESFEVN